MRGQNRFVALVNGVADGLPGQVIGNGEELQAVVAQNLLLGVAVGGVGGAFGNVEVVAPAGEFEAVKAHLFGARRQFAERQIRPLSGEKCDWS